MTMKHHSHDSDVARNFDWEGGPNFMVRTAKKTLREIIFYHNASLFNAAGLSRRLVRIEPAAEQST